MRTIFGLPAHPLLVHLAVVLVPVTAVAVVVATLRPAWRRRYHLPLFVMSVVGLLSILVARQTDDRHHEQREVVPTPPHGPERGHDDEIGRAHV